MKKLMLTTAIASVLTTAAIAQTTISGELRISYKNVDMDKGATGILTAKDGNYGFGSEQQINIQTKGKLNLGGLDYAAGMSIENDGEQTGTLFNENVYMDLTQASTGTTISFGRDHIQRSDTDYSATNLVGFSPNELSQINNATSGGTSFNQSIGAAPSQNFGAAIIQDVGTFGKFSYNFVPNNAKPASTYVDTPSSAGNVVGLAASENVNPNTTSAYEYGFVGSLGVKGLTTHYFKNANSDFAITTNEVKAEGTNMGVKYNFGQITLGANQKKHQAETTAALKIVSGSTNTGEIKETALAAAYAVNNNLTIGVIHAKAEHPGVSTLKDQVTKGINIGYNLGPVNLAVGYAQTEDSKGLTGNDTEVFMTRLIGAF
jgi:hypothetical protein